MKDIVSIDGGKIMTRDKLATSATPKFVSFSKDAGDIPFSSKEIFSSDSANPPPAVEAQNPDFLLGLEQVVALVDATGKRVGNQVTEKLTAEKLFQSNYQSS